MNKDDGLSVTSQETSLDVLLCRASKLVALSRSYIGQATNLVTVYTSFELGRYIVEEEQQGSSRAGYGKRVVEALSKSLTSEYGRGFSTTNLGYMRQFYLAYRDRAPAIHQFQIGEFMSEVNAGIRQFGIDESQGTIELDRRPFRLSWTHYLTLMRIEDHVERDFYEREAIDNNWDAKTLRRQYGSSLYERLLLSRDKDDVMRLANESATPQKPEDLLKAPYVLEFVGLEDKASYHESDLEQAVLDHLQDFLLEMGKGFLFEKRQKRFSFADRDYFLDMVLYNRYLRCYVLVDFKVDLLAHEDLGQMQMYVNYYDRYVRLPDEAPTVGILLCKRSDQALVELTLPEDAQIYAREYKLYLPDKQLLQKKLAQWLEEGENNA
jgi:predicted nuclease of restriction endonuclease-like (RecB) superfamily